MMPCQLANS